MQFCFLRSLLFVSLQRQWTPLMNAAYGNELDTVKWLCDSKADVDCKSKVCIGVLFIIIVVMGCNREEK